MKSISRLEENNGSVTVVTNSKHDGFDNIVARENDMFGVYQYGDKARVLYGGYTSDNSTNWEFESPNGLYYEVPIVVRELTSEEKEWCEDTMMYSGSSMPEEVYEIQFPSFDELENAFRSENITEYDNLQSAITNSDERSRIMKDLQEKIELADFYAKQYNFDGVIHDLPPEMNPESVDKDKETLEDVQRMRWSTFVEQWTDMFQFRYYKLRKVRYRHSNLHEPKISDAFRKIVDLELIEKDEFDYCQTCSSNHPSEELLEISVKGYDNRTLRVCEKCARMREGDLFKVDAVASAIDRRAKNRNNGQRRLHGNYQ